MKRENVEIFPLSDNRNRAIETGEYSIYCIRHTHLQLCT